MSGYLKAKGVDIKKRRATYDSVTGGTLTPKKRNIAQAELNKMLVNTEAAATLYWADMVKSQKIVYMKAIKNCKTKKCRDDKAHLKGPQYANTPKDGKNGKWLGPRGDSVWQPSQGRPPITYMNGFPDYGPHSGGDMKLSMRGNHTTDFTDARNAKRIKLNDLNWKTPKTDTWHHKEDGVTMQLIPKSIHATGAGATTPHMGGASLYTGGNTAGF